MPRCRCRTGLRDELRDLIDRQSWGTAWRLIAAPGSRCRIRPQHASLHYRRYHVVRLRRAHLGRGVRPLGGRLSGRRDLAHRCWRHSWVCNPRSCRLGDFSSRRAFTQAVWGPAGERRPRWRVGHRRSTLSWRGIPESVVLGLGLLNGKGISIAMLAVIFISNAAGRSPLYISGFG